MGQVRLQGHMLAVVVDKQCCNLQRKHLRNIISQTWLQGKAKNTPEPLNMLLFARYHKAYIFVYIFLIKLYVVLKLYGVSLSLKTSFRTHCL